jgi:hypothetical protein
MIRVADLVPTLAPPLSTPRSARAADATRVETWFDAAAADGAVRIGVDLRPSSRGLSVEQHAARVLAHLCGEAEDRG